MTFRFSGLGKSLGFSGHSGGSHGKSLFGGDKGGLFGNIKDGNLFSFGKGGHFGGSRDSDDRDCDRDDDRDDDHNSGDKGDAVQGGSGQGGASSGGAQGTGYPDIPANTAGITFAADYNGDGAADNYVPIGRDADTKTFEDYLAKARDQVATDNPDVDPKEVFFKATITPESGDETYYYFTGNEESAPVEEDDEDEDDDCDDRGDHHKSRHDNDDDRHGGHGRHRDHERDEEEDDDKSCDNDFANFFKSLVGGGKSFDTGHNDDRCDDEDEEDEDEDCFFL